MFGLRALILIPLALALVGCGLGPTFVITVDTNSPSTDDGDDSGASTSGGTCPTGYVKVVANAALGTDAFCVAQFEMKAMTDAGTPVFDTNNGGAPLSVATHKPDVRADGLPWVRISQPEALSECASIGTGYHLITAEEWGAMARDIESVASNWSSGTVGTGTLNRGHSDNAVSATAVADGLAVAGVTLLSAGTGADAYAGTGQSSADAWGAGKEQKRMWTLTSGAVIWDVGGNAREFVDVDGHGSSVSYTGPGASNYFDAQSATISAFVATLTMSASADTFNLLWLTPATAALADATHYTGLIYVSGGARAGRAMTRGANFGAGNGPGIFAADFDGAIASTSASATFRCATDLL